MKRGKCYLCDRMCDNIEKEVCCLERSLHHHLFNDVEYLCDNCKDQLKIINSKLT